MPAIYADVIAGALHTVLASQAGPRLAVMAPAAVRAIDLPPSHEQWPTVVTVDGRSLRARLLVGADGAQSSVRAAAAISTVAFPYHQRGGAFALRPDDLWRYNRASRLCIF
jgi:2-polyprenyl-6-methoxyphenol hydroxylase-like FAD-dependent oxidoreductase